MFTPMIHILHVFDCDTRLSELLYMVSSEQVNSTVFFQVWSACLVLLTNSILLLGLSKDAWLDFLPICIHTNQ